MTANDLKDATFAGQFIGVALAAIQPVPAYLTETIHRHMLAGSAELVSHKDDYDASIYQQLTAFIVGVEKMVPHSLIQGVFTPEELGSLIVGLPEIDVENWKAFTVYENGFDETSEQIQWFWNILENNFSPADRVQLLEFITGSSQVPLGGFSNLRNGASRAKGGMTVVYETMPTLPAADKSFNTLHLPAYASQDELETNLRFAMAFGGADLDDD